RISTRSLHDALPISDCSKVHRVRIRAAVLRRSGMPAPYATSLPLTIEEIDLDDPGEGEVLVAIKAAGLCHSDLSVIDGNRPRPTDRKSTRLNSSHDQ